MGPASLFVLGLGLMTSAAGHALAAPPRWGLAGGVALVSGYDSGSLSGFQETLYPHLAIQRSVNRTLWLRSEVGYEGFRSRWERRETHWVPITLGFRWLAVSDAGLGAYLDFLPALYGFRAIADSHPNGTDAGFRTRLDETRLVPGVMTGFGLQLTAKEPWYLNYGVRFHRSARPTQELEGLSQMGFELSMDWRP